VWHDSGHTVKGRDGSRVPIPWEPTGPSFGFGDGPGWLPQPASFGALAASVQERDPDSMLSLYRTALALRRRHLVDEPDFEMIDHGPGVLAFRRGRLSCVANMSVAPVPLPAGEVVLASGDLAGRELPSDTAVWLTTEPDP
jgi:alpha-glucosidase